MASDEAAPTVHYKGQTMEAFGWVLLIPFSLGVLWDLAHLSWPGPFALTGTVVGALLVARGKVVQKKRIVDEVLMESDRKKTEKQRAAESRDHAPSAPQEGDSERQAQSAQEAERALAAVQERQRREGGFVDGEWCPPVPNGTPVEPWAPGRPVEVVGEAYRPEAYRHLLGRTPGFHRVEGVEVHTDALLVPDPRNPFGNGTAVAVYAGGQHVGFLAQEDADRWYPTLAGLAAEGSILKVPARVWASDYYSRISARATITVPGPSSVRPTNTLPSVPHVVLPAGRRIQVTKEDEHMDVLARHVPRGAGAESHVAATLKSINEIRPRSSYEAVQVEIDGERVGVLTKGQSEKVLPLVRHVEQRNLIPVVRAVVTGTRLKAEVVLSTVDAETVDDDWLDSLGNAVTTANVDADRTTTPVRPEFDWDDEED